MSGPNVTLGAIAHEVRSKNAGPFWITFDVVFRTEDDYLKVVESGALSAASIAQRYAVDPALIKIFEMPGIRVIKFSFPRPCVAGSFEDRDMHAGQQHVPLLSLPIK
jgi:uncharacterized protein DUF4387